MDLITEQTAARQDIRPFAPVAFKFDAKEKRYRGPVYSFVWNQPFAGGYATDDYSQLYAATQSQLICDGFTVSWMMYDQFFDALIITGAPVETLPFEQVQYWSELEQIMDWSRTHCFRRPEFAGAQALMKHFYGLEKYQMGERPGYTITHCRQKKVA